MAVIYLKHEKHGAKVAFSSEEAEYDKTNGWFEYDPNEGVKAIETEEETGQETTLVSPTVPDFLKPSPVRRGRKPKGD